VNFSEACRIRESSLRTTRLAPMSRVGLFQPRILKDRRERRTTAVRKRIRPALAIVRDESPDGHGLHRIVDDADRAVANAGRDAEQNHAVLCAEFCSREEICNSLIMSGAP